MVKPSKIKVSKVLARIGKKPKNKTSIQVNTYPAVSESAAVSKSTSSDDASDLTEYVAFMSADVAFRTNTADTPTISVTHVSPWSMKDNHLSIPFEVGDFRESMFDRLADFIDKNAASPKFAVHCTYGSQRSRAVAHFIAAFLEHRHQRSLPVIRMKLSEKLHDRSPALGDRVSYDRMMDIAIEKGLM